MRINRATYWGLSVFSILFLSHCSRGSRFLQQGPVDVPTTTVTTTTLNINGCSPVPRLVAQATATQTIVGISTPIHFTSTGLCGNEFRIINGPLSMSSPYRSSGGVLDIVDQFNFWGTQSRQYDYQLVSPSGLIYPAVYSVVLTLTVYDSTTTTNPATTTTTVTSTTTTTIPYVAAPTCQIERVLDSSHPNTSNVQRNIWVRVRAQGQSISSITMNGVSVSADAIYAVADNTFPSFELNATVRNQYGSQGSCSLSVYVPYCTQSVVGVVEPTSVTTELTVLGGYDRVYIQGVQQWNPIPGWPWVTYTEFFASSTVNRTRTTSGRVETFAGDAWNCPVTYTVPAVAPPAPPSYLSLGQALYPGESLVPEGPNVCSCRAVMQTDGNFVVYKGTQALWATHTWNNPSSYFVFQGDSNLVVYNYAGTAKWNSRTNGRDGWRLVMQGDCNLVLYNYNYSRPLWQSYTYRPNCY